MKLIASSFLLLSIPCIGQSLSRQSISSAGNATSKEGVTVQQTIGQPYHTQTKQSEAITFRPGFQQPVFSAELISTTIEVKIYPNPVLLSFLIESSDTLYKAELNVYDERGRLIYTEKFAEFKQETVLCSEWSNGVYIINIGDQKKNLITSKVIKHQ